MTPQPSTVAVLISAYRRPAPLLLCLDSVAKQTFDKSRMSVLVHDDDSGRGAASAADSFFSKESAVSLKTGRAISHDGPPVQIAEARKRLTAEAPPADYLLFIDDDAALEPSCLETLVSYLEAHPEAGAAGPRIVQMDEPDRTLHAANFVHPWTGRYTDSDPSAPQPCDWLNSTCLLVRRSAMDRVEGFCPAFYTAHEEVDFCLQLRRKGFTVVYVPAARALHALAPSRPKRERFYYLYRNKLLVIRRQFHGMGKWTALAVALFLGGPRYLSESVSFHKSIRWDEWKTILMALADGLFGQGGAKRGYNG